MFHTKMSSLYLKHHLVETEYFSSWWLQGTPATEMLLISSLWMPKFEPFMVTVMPPFSGP